MTKQELTYWVTLALMPKIFIKRKNGIYVNCFKHNPQISIIDLFEDIYCWDELGLTNEEKSLFTTAREQLANNSFMVEDLMSQGYEILPMHSDEYPRLLKSNLGQGTPTVIFTKGNKDLLQASSIAIVGSRKADDISLQFTDNVAKRASSSNKVVVSGFAKGIDRQALDSVLNAGGKSIIVLPQGIMTFSSGFKQYYKYITQGQVLVLSSFAPKAPWNVKLAMARNPIIYGMASEIFVAQSDEKGGTWSGVMDGLKRKRKIYVRQPEANEENANRKLIQRGALPVDVYGEKLEPIVNDSKEEEQKQKEIENLNSKILKLIKSGHSSLQCIISKLDLDWDVEKMKEHLKKMPEVEIKKIKNRTCCCLKENPCQYSYIYPKEKNGFITVPVGKYNLTEVS